MPNTPAELATNISDRNAAKALFRQTVALLRSEIDALPSDRSRQIFFRLLRDAAAAKVGGGAGGDATDGEPAESGGVENTRQRLPLESEECSEALALIEEIIDKASSLPSKGWDFGEGVTARAKSIGETIEETGQVTAAQFEALENMNAGLDRWFR